MSWFVLGLFVSQLCQAQQFHLSAPELNVSSTATLTESRLEVTDAQGSLSVYHRDMDYDSKDGQWLGYLNRQSGKVLLWPVQNSGHLQIGTMQQGVMQFSPSRMQIQAIGDERTPLSRSSSSALPLSGSGEGGQSAWNSLAASDFFSRVHHLPSHRLPPEAQAVYLVSRDADGNRWAFSQRGARLGCVSQFNSRAIWWAAPAGPGLVRLQMMDQGKVWAVSAVDRQQLRLSLVANDPRQYWRICPGFQQTDMFLLENIFFSGYYLTHLGLGNIGLQPMIGLPTQMWAVLTPPRAQLALLQPFWRSVHREIRPNPPLPPAELELVNSHRNAVIVLVGDQRQIQSVQMLRIDANGSANISVERDAGATLVETVEVQSPLGDWSRQEFVTQIPPTRLIDLSVYEEFLQSIAIDRTGKSPNRIEEINYVPRSIGLFLLAAGSDLPDKSRIDVYSQAVAENNPGAVRRLNPQNLERKRQDPVESILERELNRDREQSSEPPNDRRSF